MFSIQCVSIATLSQLALITKRSSVTIIIIIITCIMVLFLALQLFGHNEI